MNCEEFEELSGAYAIGSLLDDERVEADAHLATCDKHPEIAELVAVANSLALAAPAMDPPPELKSRLMEAIQADATLAMPMPREREETSRGFFATVRSWFTSPGLGYGLAGAMAVLVIGLLAWNVSLQGDNGGANTLVVDMAGQASGQVVFLTDKNIAVMDLQGLQDLPSDKVYEVWAMSDGKATALGVFLPTNGGVQASMKFDATGYDTIAVTVENAPGVDQPTSDPITSGKL